MSDDDLLRDDDAGGMTHHTAAQDNDEGGSSAGSTGILDGLDDSGGGLLQGGNLAEGQADDGIDLVIREDDDAGAGTELADDEGNSGALSLGVGDDDGGEELSDDYLTQLEKKNWSLAMQKRVQRERRIAADAKARAEAAEAMASNAQKLAVENWRAKAFALDTMLENLDFKIAAKTAELKRAKEEADTDAEIKAQTDLAELQATKRDAVTAKSQMGTEPPTLAPATTGAEAPTGVQALATKWLSQNRWLQDKRFAAEANYVRFIDQQLAAEGKLKPDDPAYYVEWNRRIKEAMPALHSKIRATFGPGPQQPSRGSAPRVAAPNRQPPRSASAQAGGRNTVVLTKADLENARSFGIDVNDKKQLLEYARNKTNRIAQERASAARG